MSVFTDGEIAYMNSQRLGRLATVDTRGELHVVPIAFRYNPETDTVDIGGFNMAFSKKYRDVAESRRAAFVVDDVLAPGQPRGLEVRGSAETLGATRQDGDPREGGELIRITPRRIVGWGIDTAGTARNFQPNSRNVNR